jgi:lipopolysaccharide biosynthesis protein
MRVPSFGRRRSRVIDVQVGVHAEGTDHLADAEAPERVALVAHWAPDNKVSRSVSELVRVLTDDGYAVALMSAAAGAEPLVWPVAVPEGLTIIRRPNMGYDFGSWATGLARYPAAAHAAEVLLVNDSLAGPFRPIDHILRDFHDSKADVWGLTDTTQHTHHIQSYCLGFKSQVLNEPPLAEFWRNVCIEASRNDVIQRYELGLSRLLHREAYTIEAAFRYQNVIGGGLNPTVHGWRRLLDLGFPFVKRELLRKPEVARDGADVPGEIWRRYGIKIGDWL